eukprot:TRINITY_DN914_c0_g1::TRINITY_DN914_c0_g1_i2::g.15960::m.15960 TRINITY_DN914_c0_g1::TRINITY_DN914_c0_g1_i2::g.15960  ORF type:complete len:415 (+),score=64.53,sp/Q6IP50/UBX1A_XENLA/28.37/3e-07,PUB/PF09409.5/6.5e+02,PUB/PF09409.5/2.4e+03,PUB/PF09409.5/2.8e-19,DZR/PF12773.2/0.04,zf-C2H2_2/PF12756.2/0.14,zf-C2H2_2/PF12756.2/14,UBA/PF00627.26/0.3,UBA/PF00627.26/5.8e+03,UBA/PF00627.26/3.6e+03,zf-C2H2/PF00096.21/73,zf-C2H2/PF00096.21/2.2,GFA/PF04828.9/1.1e+02,GFA/PF04828.9/2.7,Lamp/PF01299.12/1.1e+03,L
MAQAKSLTCLDCGAQLKSHEEAQQHAEMLSHINFEESTSAVKNIVCNECGKPCRSEDEQKLHTQRTGHPTFTDKTGTEKPIVLPTPSTSHVIEAHESSKAPEILGGLFRQLVEELGFPEVRAQNVLIRSHADTIEEAVNWLTDHADDPDIDLAPEVQPILVDEKKKMTPEEKRVKIEELRLKAKARREAIEKQDEIEKERNRVRLGKELAKARREREEIDRKLAAEQVVRQKKADKEYLEQLQAQVRAEKAARLAAMGKSAEAASTTAPSSSTPTPKPTPTPQPSNAPKTISIELRDLLIAFKRAHQVQGDAVVQTAFQTLFKFVANVVQFPNDEKYRRIRISNDAFQSRVGRLDGGVQFLQKCGFNLEGEFLSLSQSNINIEVLTAAGKELDSAINNPFFGTL